jgi:hypothetical protein
MMYWPIEQTFVNFFRLIGGKGFLGKGRVLDLALCTEENEALKRKRKFKCLVNGNNAVVKQWRCLNSYFVNENQWTFL